MRRTRANRKRAAFATSVFAEMTALATRHDALNLGQGFPDFDGPEFVKEAATAAIAAGHNQYAPMPGLPSLRRAIADHQRRFYGLQHDAESELTVHAGATEAICATLLALLTRGDEVVVFEPFYDSYQPCVALAGARPRIVALEPPDFRVQAPALDAAIGPKTRALILNSPGNPSGHVLTREELEAIAAVCVRHDLLCVTDEVYEHIVFEGRHVPVASLPGMRERTVTISSSAKSFSLTGWKLGWSCAPPELTEAIRAVHQFVIYAVATPFQHAIAAALAASDRCYETLQADYRARRDRLSDGLATIGFGVRRPEGATFVLGDIRPLGYDDDEAFCRRMVETVGVAAIPVSAFTVDRRLRHLVRFAFCKDDATLEEALRRLRRLRA